VATSLKARLAHLRDAAAIAEIYNQGIEDRTATFETEPRTAAAVEELVQRLKRSYGTFRATRVGRLLGAAARD
jgi:L-amino acid N-acyltransferase YncA